MTNYAIAKKAHNWLYRGVSVANLKANFGENVVELIRSLATHKNTSMHYDSATVEALMVNNK